MYVEHIRTSSHNQNEQLQYVYHCCLCLIFDQTTMAQEQKYSRKECFCKGANAIVKYVPHQDTVKRTTWRKGLDRCFLDVEFAPDYESIQVDEWDLSPMVKGPTFLSLTASGQVSETLLTKAITESKSRGTSFGTTLSHHVQRHCFLSI